MWVFAGFSGSGNLINIYVYVSMKIKSHINVFISQAPLSEWTGQVKTPSIHDEYGDIPCYTCLKFLKPKSMSTQLFFPNSGKWEELDL